VRARIRPSALRVRLNKPTYTPEWNETFQRWAKHYVDKHFWRVKHVYITKDDALQECAVVFARCARNYTGKIDNPAWFMSIYKVAIVNEWNKASLVDQNHRDITYCDDLTSLDSISCSPSNEGNSGPFLQELRQCQSELQYMADILTRMPSELFDFLSKDGSRKSRRQRVKRCYGPMKDLTQNIVEQYMDLRTSSVTAAEEALVDLNRLINV
jgi:hypothetical protein